MAFIPYHIDRAGATHETYAIIDEKVVEYHLCSDSKDAYDKTKFRWIGECIIYKVNGVVQTGEKLHQFYVRGAEEISSGWECKRCGEGIMQCMCH